MLDKKELEKRFKAQRGCAFSLVLNDTNDGLILKSAKYIFKVIGCAELPFTFLAVMKHDKDVSDDGHLKTLHYHVVIVLSRSCRIGTFINVLLKEFTGLNENQISIEKCNSVSMQVRYLIHLDDFDKWQYDEKDIVSSNEGQVSYYLHEVHKIVDINDLISVVKEYKSLAEIMRVLGIDNYKKYRMIIKDLREVIYGI